MTHLLGDDWMTVYGGDCRAVMAELPADSIQTVVTSPPYFNLRTYPVPDSVWGGSTICEHDWSEGLFSRQKNNQHVGGRLSSDRNYAGRAARTGEAGRECVKCAAWLGQWAASPIRGCTSRTSLRSSMS